MTRDQLIDTKLRIKAEASEIDLRFREEAAP